MEILIVNKSELRIPRKFIQGWIEEVYRELKKRKILSAQQVQRDLTLVFLKKTPARKINAEFRGKDYATDVLSFDSLDPSSLGELVLCSQVLKKQAKEHDLSFQHELGYMLLHGVLHLLGYDHERSAKEAKEMFAIQDAIFAKLRQKL